MYKTIVVHVDDTPHFKTRLAVAAGLATRYEGHLVGSAVTGMSMQSFIMLGSSAVAALPGDFDELRQRANDQLAAFAAAAERLGVASWEQRMIEDDAEHALLLESRYADLVVLSPGTPPGGRLRVISDLPDYVALHGTRPVLVVPHGYPADTVGSTVVVGWDAGAEACRAVTAALPLLKEAKSVIVALVNPEPLGGRHGEEPGADVATWLARHGVRVEVRQEHAHSRVGIALAGMAREAKADLLVAGAYGHSRFREWIVGGATRDLLDDGGIPLLLAH